VVRAGNLDYWKRLVGEYRKQTVWNEIVPLVIQEEYASIGDALRRQDPESLEVLNGLFQYLREQRIRVVTMQEAVNLYRKAYPTATPPTYALFDNLGTNGLAAQSGAASQDGPAAAAAGDQRTLQQGARRGGF
jgi:hypothetical protein